MPSIRPLYEQHGPEAYYRDHAEGYENPHFPQIKALLEQNLHRLDCSGGVLDFAAGGGEVTRVLQTAGITDLAGCDPYTQALYTRQTGLHCLPYDFKTVVLQGLPKRYSLIVSSFALHLCPPKDLFLLTWNLLEAAPLLVVITPHKRPELELLPGISLVWEDDTLTEKGKKVRMKAYQRSFEF